MTGRLIAIEGIDGAGKGTQAKLLRERFEAAGRAATVLSFPRYEQTRFGALIGEYLNQSFGTLDSIHPLFASLLFAGDRWESKPLLMESLTKHDVVICDRYVGSNIAHQGARVSESERESLIERIQAVEFGVYGLPRPALTILLDATVPTGKALVARKSRRSYTDDSEDMHESDGAYLEAVRRVYRELCAASADWAAIPVDDESGIRSIEQIAEDVWRAASSTF